MIIDTTQVDNIIYGRPPARLAVILEKDQIDVICCCICEGKTLYTLFNHTLTFESKRAKEGGKFYKLQIFPLT